MLAAHPRDTVIPRRFAAQEPYIAGRLQAWRLAGDWPESGSIAELAASVDRAADALRFVQRLEVRWFTRYRVWAARDKWAMSEPMLERLKCRLEAAKEIAEARAALFRRLLIDRAGSA